MLSNAYFLAKIRFDTAENEPAKILQNFHLARCACTTPPEVATREQSPSVACCGASTSELARGTSRTRRRRARRGIPAAEFQPRPALLPFPRQRRATLHRVRRSEDFGAVRYVNRMIFSFSCPENSDFPGNSATFWGSRSVIRYFLEHLRKYENTYDEIGKYCDENRAKNANCCDF